MDTHCSMRRTFAVGMVLLFALALIAIVIPSSQGADVTVFPMNSDTNELVGDSEITVSYVVFNNGTSPYLVKGSVTPAKIDGVSAGFDEDFATIDPGRSHTFVVEFSASRNVKTFDAEFAVDFTATQMDDPGQIETFSQPVHLNVVSIFGVTTGENKILKVFENPFPAPFNTNFWSFIFSVLIWVAVGTVFYFVVDPLAHLFTKRTDSELDDILLRILRLPIFVLIVLIGTVNSVEILDLPGDIISNVEMAYHILLILVFAWIAYKVYDEVIIYLAKEYAKKTNTELDDAMLPIMEKLGMIVIPLIAIMAIFSIMGYDLTVLLVGAGFLGIVIGLAAQSTLANFFAGMQMLVERPFKVGDSLLLENGNHGEIVHLGLRATEILDTTNDYIIVIPNDKMANNPIINVMRPGKELTIAVSVGVAYGSDIELVKQLMDDAAMEIPSSVKSKKPRIRLSDFADSTINMKIFIDIDDANARWKAASDFRERLYAKFADKGIEIPLPQTVVHLKDERKAN
jgi:MscS family membrane protein